MSSSAQNCLFVSHPVQVATACNVRRIYLSISTSYSAEGTFFYTSFSSHSRELFRSSVFELFSGCLDPTPAYYL